VLVNVNRAQFQNKSWMVSASITRRKLSPFDAGNIVLLVVISVMRYGIDARYGNKAAWFMFHLVVPAFRPITGRG